MNNPAWLEKDYHGNDVPKECLDLIKNCCLVNVEARWTAQRLLQHPWLNGTEDRDRLEKFRQYQGSITSAIEENSRMQKQIDDLSQKLRNFHRESWETQRRKAKSPRDLETLIRLMNELIK